MNTRFRNALRTLLPSLAALTLASEASASTLNQNVSWTIDRAGTTTKYRVVAYGDSIYAGYNGSTINAAKYAAPTVDAEYLSALWNADIESVRRTKSGAVASDVYNNKIVAERSYMQASNTRVVTFEMCGNDGLQARSSFKSQTGTCNYSVLTAAENNCKTYVTAAMDYINANAYAGVKLKVISNLHYPGYAADNVQSSCKDATTGATVKMQDKFLPSIARMNFMMCDVARLKGLPVRRQLRPVHGCRLRQQRRRPDRLRRAALRRRRKRSQLCHAHRHDTALHAARCQHALRLIQQQLRLHPVRRHPPDLHRRHRHRRPVRRQHRHGCAALHLVQPVARIRSGTSTATSAWAGRYRPSIRQHRDSQERVILGYATPPQASTAR